MTSTSMVAEVVPFEAIAGRLRQCFAALSAATRKLVRVHAYSGGHPNGTIILPPAEGEQVLLLGLDSQRIRIGPALDNAGDGCIQCLSYWLDQNRPDADLWRQISAEVGTGATAPRNGLGTLAAASVVPASSSIEGELDAALPWIPVHYQLLEALALEALLHPIKIKRSFVDIDVRTLRVETHHYQPSPACDRCTPKRADEAHDVQVPPGEIGKAGFDRFRSRPLPSSSELRERFVDYRVGLVNHMYREQNSTMLPMWGAESRVPHVGVPEVGFGRHELTRTCESVAILEALERYCGYAPRGRTVTVRNSYSGLCELGLPVVNPRSFVLPGPEQQSEPGYNLTPYSDELVFDWIWAYSWRRRSAVLIPLQLCFYGGGIAAADRFVIETSSGCAIGGSLEEAALHGLFEVIERDAYMTRWHLRGNPQRIELNDPSIPQVQRLYARATSDGYQLSAFAIPLEIPLPVVLAMIVDPRKNAPVASYCASAAHAVAASAVMGALVEVCTAIQVYQKPFAQEKDKARALYEDASLVQSMRDHVLLYSLPEASRRLHYLNPCGPAAFTAEVFRDQEKPWRSLSLSEDLNRLITATCEVADDVIIVDQTAALLQPLEMHCVKVLAPGLMPVTFGHQYRRISLHRLQAARWHLQQKGEPHEPDLNPFPHNFP